MATRRCLACGTVFSLRAQTPNQAYCPSKACQRDRRKRWQRDRRACDIDSEIANREPSERGQQLPEGTYRLKLMSAVGDADVDV